MRATIKRIEARALADADSEESVRKDRDELLSIVAWLVQDHARLHAASVLPADVQRFSTAEEDHAVHVERRTSVLLKDNDV